MLAQGATAQSKAEDTKPAETKAADSKPPEARAQRVEIYKTFYLTHALRQNDLNDVQTALRNVLPRARIYGMPSPDAICVLATAEELQLAQRVVTDLDLAPKVYRLTFTIHEIDGGKRTGEQHYSMIVAASEKTDLKQGTRVPIATGSAEAGGSSSTTQFQYVDVGLSIEANFDGSLLRSKIEQSAVAEEKSGVGAQDPVLRETQLQGYAALVEGKPAVIGAMDVPGSTRREEIEVIVEAVK